MADGHEAEKMLRHLFLVHALLHAARAHRVGAAAVRCSAADKPVISFANTRWAPLQKHLDTLPVFTCVNADGNPLGYERDGEPIALYFAEAERAQQELQQMGERFPELGLRIIGVGLGDIFRQHTEGRALLVPGAAAIAGAGEGWDSETMPLYTCLAMSSAAPDGTGLDLPAGAKTTPLFMCPRDAQASLDAALENAKAGGASAEQLASLQLVCTSLPTAVDIVLSGREAEACGDTFQFVAPRASLAFLQETRATDSERGRRELEALKRRPTPAKGTGDLLFPS